MSQRSSSLLAALDASSSTPDKGWHNANMFTNLESQEIDKWPSSTATQVNSQPTQSKPASELALYKSQQTYSRAQQPSNIVNSVQNGGQRASNQHVTLRSMLSNTESDSDEVLLVEESVPSQFLRSPNAKSPRMVPVQHVAQKQRTTNNTRHLTPIKRNPNIPQITSTGQVLSTNSLPGTVVLQTLPTTLFNSGQILTPTNTGTCYQTIHVPQSHARGPQPGLNNVQSSVQASIQPMSTAISGEVVPVLPSNHGQYQAGTFGVFRSPHQNPKLVMHNGTDWAIINHDLTEKQMSEMVGAMTKESTQALKSTPTPVLILQKDGSDASGNAKIVLGVTPTKLAAHGSNQASPVMLTLTPTKQQATGTAVNLRALHVRPDSTLDSLSSTTTGTGESVSMVTGGSGPSITLGKPAAVSVVSSSCDSTQSAPEEKRIKWPNDGRVAVCGKCGACSKDYYKCESCGRPLPKQPKFYYPQQKLKTPPKHKKQVVLSKKEFYGKKLQEQSQPYSAGALTFDLNNALDKKGKTLVRITQATRGKGGGRPRKQPTPEPETVTILSSDEEEQLAAVSSPTVNAATPEPSTPVDKLTRRQKMENEMGNVVDGTKSLSRPSTPAPDSPQVQGDSTCSQMYLVARSVRLGSYKGTPFEPIKISCSGICINMEAEDKTVKLNIEAADIVCCLAHFGTSMPVLFLFTSAGSGCKIRSLCHMNAKCGPYYDPGSKEECHKRIVILLKDTIDTLEQKNFNDIFKVIGMQHHHGKVILKFIDYQVANQVLITSTPNQSQVPLAYKRSLKRKEFEYDIQKVLAQAEEEAERERSPSPVRQVFSGPVVKLFVFPPPPSKGGILVTNEDMFCLNEGEFLNDVIIDFYLKHLFSNVLSPEDQKRTHMFNSFFYKRLTGKAHKGSENATMTLSQKRHNKVKTWTRHVDIFEKDFVVIPINENSHWFLAIICFPGLPGPVLRKAPSLQALETCYNADSNDSSNAAQTNEDTVSEQPSATEGPSSTTMEGTEKSSSQSDEFMKSVDGCQGDVTMDTVDQNESMKEDEDDDSGRGMPKCSSAVVYGTIEKQPCILVFDSLAGPSRSQVIRTLRDYLQIEWDTRKKTPRAFNKDTIKGGNPKVPQQDNYSDCGVYICQYVESFFKNPIPDFGIPMKCTKEWFADQVIKGKRKEIMTLIETLYEENKALKSESSS